MPLKTAVYFGVSSFHCDQESVIFIVSGGKFANLSNEHYSTLDSVIGWTCQDECRYTCMWPTVEAFRGRNWNVPQFHGKVSISLPVILFLRNLCQHTIFVSVALCSSPLYARSGLCLIFNSQFHCSVQWMEKVSKRGETRLSFLLDVVFLCNGMFNYFSLQNFIFNDFPMLHTMLNYFTKKN